MYNPTKVAIVGDAHVGKSKFCDMARDIEFVVKPYLTTIMTEVKIIGTFQNAPSVLLFYDVSGDERYKKHRSYHFPKMDSFIVIHKGNPQPWIDYIRTTRPDAEIMTLNIKKIKTQRDAHIWMTERFGKNTELKN
jgi:GTPase SAR1 family protein